MANIFKKTISIALVMLLIFVIPVGFCSFESSALSQSKISSELLAQLSNKADDELVKVSIWFNDVCEAKKTESLRESFSLAVEQGKVRNTQPQAIGDDLITAPENTPLNLKENQTMVQIERDSSKNLYQQYNNSATQQVKTKSRDEIELVYSCSFAPNIVTQMTVSDVYRVVSDPTIDTIYSYDDTLTVENPQEDGVITYGGDDMAILDGIASVGADYIRDEQGKTGENIKIGMFDGHVPSVNAATFAHATESIYRHDTIDYRDNHTDMHSTAVASTILGKMVVNGETVFSGVVPDATLYCTARESNRCNNSATWKESFEWLVQNGVNVINISHTVTEANATGYNDTSRWIDHIAYQHSVTVVASSGNSNYGDGNPFVSPLVYCHNAIIVSDVKLEIDADGNYVFSEKSDTAYTNSNVFYPHVLAPGKFGSINRIGVANASGSSFSAPIVTGMVAQLMQADNSLLFNPTLVKAIIMAGANGMKSSTEVNVNGTDMDRKFGAGVVNAINSYSLVGGTSTSKIYTSYYATGLMNDTNLQMYITDNSNPIRLALTWNRKSTIDGNHSEATVNEMVISFLRLTVTSPKGVEYASFDLSNPFQLLVFEAPNDDLGAYTVKISRHGPSGYGTHFSLAAYGCDFLT